jgi:hypothetical protein
MNARIEMMGLQFGRLTVIASVTSTAKGQARWLCRCECGSEAVIVGAKLRNGHTKSCGCLHDEKAPLNAKKTALGEALKTPEWKSWTAMKQRCSWSGHKHYALYGGRGIKVCKRWLDSYETFLADMGRRPSMKHSIDRFPDKEGNYEPGNCRWATQSEQNRNRAPYRWKKNR